MPFTPAHSGSSSGTSNSGSSSSTSSTGTSGSGTSSSGTSSGGSSSGGSDLGNRPERIYFLGILTQTQSGGQILSSGSEVMTKHTFSYGTFEFTSRVVNVLSGSDSSGFLYASNSETEIDMEQVGNKPDAVDCTNWNGVSNFQDTEVTGFNQGNSHDFKIVWQPRFVDWYVDGQLVVIPRRCPALPLHFCLICGARTSRVGEERRPLDPRGTCTSATSSTLRNTLRGRRDRMEGCGFRSCPSSSAEHVRLWPP